MKRILVPTDFSKCSESAIDYAISLATSGNEQVEIILLHVYHPVLISEQVPADMMFSVIEEQKKYTSKKLAELCEEKIHTLKLNVSCKAKTVLGFAAEEIVKIGGFCNIDYIVMGTKGASGLSGFFLGSVAGEVVTKSPVPVFIVPDNYKSGTPEKIVFASELSENDIGHLKQLSGITSDYQHNLTVVHVIPEKDKLPEKEKVLSSFKSKATEQAGPVKINFKIIINDDVANALQEHCGKERADLLVMMPRKRSFISRIFHNSNTKQVAYSAGMPLLVLPEKSSNKQVVVQNENQGCNVKDEI